MPVRIVTDSTCDLPRDLVEQAGITVVPLIVLFGDEALRDGVDIDAPTFYERLKASRDLPRTSQPSVETFRETYEALAKDTNEIVSIHVSSKLSGTLNSATIARDQVSHELHIELVDSYNVSVGLGAIVLEAAAAANAGATMAEVVEVTRRAMDRVYWAAFLDTLEYLHRGGRIGKARSLVGSILSIKPLLHCEDGEIAPFERVRTRAKAVERLFEIATQDRTVKRLIVAAAGNEEEAMAFTERLRPVMPHTEFILGQIGPVVGVHAGPGALGVCMVRRD
jgi:DegV family protein with EDD domain